MSDADRTALRFNEEGTFGTTPDGELLAKTTIHVVAADDSYNDSVENLAVFKAKQTILVSGCTTSANDGYKEVVTAPTRPTGSIVAAATLACVSATKKYTDSGDGLGVFVAGQKILASGFTEGANNGIKNIVSVEIDGSEMVVTEALTDEGAAAGRTLLSISYITVKEALADDVATPAISIKTAYKEIRHTGESLKQDTTIQESTEIRDDRQVADVKRMSIQASGDVNVEMSYGAIDEFIEAALGSADWSSEVEVSAHTTYAAVAATNKITDSGASLVTDGFLANQWVEVRGFTTNPTNNGYYKIVSVVEAEMVLEGGTLLDEAVDAGKTIVITQGPQITNGTSIRSFSIEREYSDLASEFALYNGMTVSQLVLNIVAEQIITAVVSFMGKSEDSATASTGTGTPEVAPTNDVTSAVDDILALLENMTDTDASSLTLTVNANLRARSVIGELGPIDMGAGKVGVTGTVQMYFESKAIMDKYIDQTESSLAFVIEDSAGNVYILDLPRIKYTGGQRVAGGENTDVIADMAFSAYRESTEDVTIRIAKFDA